MFDLQAVGYGLVLIDGGKSNIYKLDTKKKINIAHIDRAFKVCGDDCVCVCVCACVCVCVCVCVGAGVGVV